MAYRTLRMCTELVQKLVLQESKRDYSQKGDLMFNILYESLTWQRPVSRAIYDVTIDHGVFIVLLETNTYQSNMTSLMSAGVLQNRSQKGRFVKANPLIDVNAIG